jgi:hypothetical protein
VRYCRTTKLHLTSPTQKNLIQTNLNQKILNQKILSRTTPSQMSLNQMILSRTTPNQMSLSRTTTNALKSGRNRWPVTQPLERPQ